MGFFDKIVDTTTVNTFKQFFNPLTGNRAANWQLSGKRGCSPQALPVCKYVNWQRGFTRGCQSKG